MQRYKKRPEFQITAVQIRLETDGLSYQKWGDTQLAKANDWLVDTGDNVYTIEDQAFTRTYRQVSPGRYEKVAPVFAKQAERDGSIETLEGRTHYSAGDYLVYESPDDSLGAYAIKKDDFERMYVLLKDEGRAD